MSRPRNYIGIQPVEMGQVASAPRGRAESGLPTQESFLPKWFWYDEI